MATEAVIIDAVRTPMGRHGGILKDIRPDDLAAHVIFKLLERNSVNGGKIEDVYFGCTNQGGEDSRNLARNASLLAGLPVTVAGSLSTACAAPAWRRSTRRPGPSGPTTETFSLRAGWKT